MFDEQTKTNRISYFSRKFPRTFYIQQARLELSFSLQFARTTILTNFLNQILKKTRKDVFKQIFSAEGSTEKKM